MSSVTRSASRASRLVLVLCLLAAAILATSAAAYWTSVGAGAAGGHVATLAAPTVTVDGGNGSAAVSWTAVTAPAGGTVRYAVRRDDGTPGPGCPSASSPAAVTSCTDTGLDAGTHRYTVTAIWRSWTATSPSVSASVAAPMSVAAVSPTSAVAGTSSQNVTITGSGFVSGSSVAFAGGGITVNSTTYVSATQLTANVTIAAGATPGARDVTVTRPDSSAATKVNAFKVISAPTIASLSPAARGQGAANQTITVTGTGFATGSVVTFSGTAITVNSTTYVSATQLTADVSIATGATAGARSVTVTNADGGTATKASAFTVNAAPTLTTVAPPSRVQGASNQTITLTGTGFVTGAAVSIAGGGVTVNSTTYVSATQLTASISVAAIASTGPRDVTVANGDGGTTTKANAFTVNAVPALTSLSPAARGQGAKNQVITLTGTGFASGSAVTFSGTGITVNSTTYVSATQLTANVSIGAAAAVGPRDVSVTNADGGTTTKASAFAVNGGPTITSPTAAAPFTIARNGTGTLVITGTGFVTGLTVDLGNMFTINSTTVNSATQVTVNLTAKNKTTADLTVTNGDGGTATSANAVVTN